MVVRMAGIYHWPDPYALPMTRGRLVGVIVLALVLLTGGAYAGWRQVGGDYDHALERYGDEAGEPHRFVDLPDGEAQLAIGSPDGHRVVVQWRDPDGSGWTAPETVWRDRSMVALDNTVRYGGGTVAIRQTFSPDVTVAAVLVCERTGGAGRAAYVVVASPDLAAWESRFVADVRGQPEVTDERVRVGPLTWTPEDGFSD